MDDTDYIKWIESMGFEVDAEELYLAVEWAAYGLANSLLKAGTDPEEVESRIRDVYRHPVDYVEGEWSQLGGVGIVAPEEIVRALAGECMTYEIHMMENGMAWEQNELDK